MRPPRPDFEWLKLPPRELPRGELQRIDDAVSRPTDEQGGAAGDAVAQPAMGLDLTPPGLRVVWGVVTGRYTDEGSGQPLYTFVAIVTESNAHVDVEGGLTGVALEVNGNVNVPTGAACPFWPSEDSLAGAAAEKWRFSHFDLRHLTLPFPTLPLASGPGSGPGSGSGSGSTPPSPGCDVLIDGTGDVCFGEHVTLHVHKVDWQSSFGLSLVTSACAVFSELRPGAGIVITEVSPGVYEISSSGGGGTTYTADESTLHLTGTVFSVKALGVNTAQLADAVSGATGVTLAKMAYVNINTVLGRRIGVGAGPVQEISLANLKLDLNLAGSNTGDQTSIVGITGTLAQFNAACTDADFAPIASPTLTGTPAAPTAAAGTNTTQLATTAFVTSAVAAAGYVPTSRTIGTTAPLTGGGDLSADRTLAVSTFVGAGGTAARGVVPAPGATAHPNRPYYLGDDAAWHKRAGEFIDGGFVSTIETTASTTAADLTTVQSYTFTLDEASDVVVIVGATVSNDTLNAINRLYVTIDGTATLVAQFKMPAVSSNYNVGNQYLSLALASGAHTVKIQFGVNAGTGSFSNRSITIWRGKA